MFLKMATHPINVPALVYFYLLASELVMNYLLKVLKSILYYLKIKKPFWVQG